ncbi:hypothetical protein C8R44DRAFT_816894 [Mycena epipterygia]|nr:hypothetical protein C8R44DRAFT_816894 [Mycena epipterygia]
MQYLVYGCDLDNFVMDSTALGSTNVCRGREDNAHARLAQKHLHRDRFPPQAPAGSRRYNRSARDPRQRRTPSARKRNVQS